MDDCLKCTCVLDQRANVAHVDPVHGWYVWGAIQLQPDYEVGEGVLEKANVILHSGRQAATTVQSVDSYHLLICQHGRICVALEGDRLRILGARLSVGTDRHLWLLYRLLYPVSVASLSTTKTGTPIRSGTRCKAGAFSQAQV